MSAYRRNKHSYGLGTGGKEMRISMLYQLRGFADGLAVRRLQGEEEYHYLSERGHHRLQFPEGSETLRVNS